MSTGTSLGPRADWALPTAHFSFVERRAGARLLMEPVERGSKEARVHQRGSRPGARRSLGRLDGGARVSGSAAGGREPSGSDQSQKVLAEDERGIAGRQTE